MIRLPIFRYHHVCESLPPVSYKNMAISVAHFEQQMSLLYQRGLRCLSLLDVLTNWKQDKPQPERSFVLTFDDGYIDNFENASPILKKFGFTATIFVVVKKVEEGNKRYLSWQEIRELAQNQFTFGSHTLTHPRLCSLDNMTIRRELHDSKKIIQDRLGQPVVLLAYPYGESNELIQDIACESGYQAACGVTSGYLTPFNLWRVPINANESELSFYWKSSGGYYRYTWLRETTYVGKKMRAFKRYVNHAKS